MKPNAKSAAIDRVRHSLQEELGHGQIKASKGHPEGPIAFCYPGGEYPILIFQHDTPMGSILRIDAPVTAKGDWTPGLAEFLIREAGDWLFGRAERWGDGVTIEYSLLADTPTDKLAAIILGLADTALRLRHDLSQAGALSLTEEAI
jgi:hypothetical protein